LKLGYFINYIENFQLVTIKEIEEKVAMDRCWVYRCLSNLEEKSLVAVERTSNPWKGASYELTIRAKIKLTKIKKRFHGW